VSCGLAWTCLSGSRAQEQHKVLARTASMHINLHLLLFFYISTHVYALHIHTHARRLGMCSRRAPSTQRGSWAMPLSAGKRSAA